MNIYAASGYRVWVTPDTFNRGSTYDREVVNKYLKLKETYHIKKTTVHKFNTIVELKEVPGVEFNSVMFDDIDFQDELEDSSHPDWDKWN